MTGRISPGQPIPGAQPAAWVPPTIANIEATGLTLSYLADLILKHLYFAGELVATKVADAVKLPLIGVVDGALDALKKDKLVEVKGAVSGIGDTGTRYAIVGEGVRRARELLDRSQYAGPAPVPLEAYINSVKMQNRNRIYASPELMKKALGHLVISDKMYGKIGPAVNSGKSIFLYGKPGNGKTTIAEAVGKVILGADMWIPYAIDVDGQVIRVYDNVNHTVIEDSTGEAGQAGRPTGVKRDPRWLRIRRPVIVVGGELTLAGLDLIYDPINKFYEAPYQLKCNGGMFLIDDFGRQQARPRDLLNRWIVPLEKSYDYLTLATGRKIEIPFNVLIVFSTNIDPADLVDEAFLRRIRHKIEVGDPTPQEFVEIFKRVCEVKRVAYDENGLKYLIQEHYLKKERAFRSVHPRDILDQLLDIARYLNRQPKLDRDLLDMACDSYFVQL